VHKKVIKRAQINNYSAINKDGALAYILFRNEICMYSLNGHRRQVYKAT